MIINHNISAMSAQRYFKLNTSSFQSNIRKLASGLRITRGADDAAGLAVSEKMRAQVRGMRQASRNAQDGIAMIQTTEGYLNETSSILQRMRELAVQAANGIYTTEDRMQIKTEIEQLVDEVDRISSQAEFNTMRMLRGGFGRAQEAQEQATVDRATARAEANKSALPLFIPVEKGADSSHPLVRQEGDVKGGLYFHIGANTDQREITFIGDMSATALGLAKGPADAQGKRELFMSYMTQDGANEAIQVIDSALYVVNKQRADLGGYQNRLEGVVRGLDIAAENIQSAESYIRDADITEEMVDFMRNQILTQSSAAMLGQANLRSQVVLKVLE